MRYYIIVLLTLTFSVVAFAQSNDTTTENLVRTALDPKLPGISTGSMDKQFSRMGDATAVAITKVLAGKNLTQADIERILPILMLSFSAPAIVANESDRRPRTALFLVACFQRYPLDPAQKKRVTETEHFLTSLMLR